MKENMKSELPKRKPPLCDYCSRTALIIAGNGDRYCAIHMPDDLEDQS
jgi:hypothetical protein